ncbi:metallophosphoesterase family protein [Xanthobacter agilis]|uniref:metallophosphoesterase family protein n=1 Tax=Xanthobacter agilis TaxID=47492 RepID=UPI00372B0AAC
MRVYAVGDIHGEIDILRNLHRQMEADQAAHRNRIQQEIYLGDMVDRGPDSAAVLSTLIERRRARGAICLSGNHEDMMLEAHRGLAAFIHWIALGGLPAVLSYLPELAPVVGELEVRELWDRWRRAIPEAHLTFLHSLSVTHVCGDYLFVHAGVRPGVPVEAQSRHDCLWIRHDFLRSEETFSHVVVHGHTPVPVPELRANRIGIDTGAVFTGRLTCLVLDGSEQTLLST